MEEDIFHSLVASSLPKKSDDSDLPLNEHMRKNDLRRKANTAPSGSVSKDMWANIGHLSLKSSPLKSQSNMKKSKSYASELSRLFDSPVTKKSSDWKDLPADSFIFSTEKCTENNSPDLLSSEFDSRAFSQLNSIPSSPVSSSSPMDYDEDVMQFNQIFTTFPEKSRDQNPRIHERTKIPSENSRAKIPGEDQKSSNLFFNHSSTEADIDPASKSKRVVKMREKEKIASEAAEQESELRADVDSAVSCWKDKKEKNIRGLLASLDRILWPELNYKVVGIAELLDPKKVKLAYMKAISKIHPDKVKSDTIYHKMIAHEVFIALNAAWEIFKTQK